MFVFDKDNSWLTNIIQFRQRLPAGFGAPMGAGLFSALPDPDAARASHVQELDPFGRNALRLVTATLRRKQRTEFARGI